jgi:hypothetical protein
MRVLPTALIALLASEANAFVPLRSVLRQKKPTKLSMADAYDLSSDVPEAAASPKPATTNTATTTTNSRVEGIRAQLQQEIANAEAARGQVLREIEEAELRRGQLEQEATQSLADAAARRQKLETFEAQQAAAAAGGGLLAGAAAPIALGSLGAIAFGRSALASRQKKIEEQQIIEAEKAAKAAEAASASGGNILAVSSHIYRCSLHIMLLSGLLRWQTHSFCHIFFGKNYSQFLVVPS